MNRVFFICARRFCINQLRRYSVHSPRHLYINLDQATGRRTHIETIFEDLTIVPTRVPAIDGRKLDEPDYRKLNPPTPTYQPLTPGEIGCFLSHRRVWQMIADGNEPMVAVFEDDVHLAQDACKWITNFDWVPKGVDFVKLDTHNQPVLLGTETSLPDSHRRLSKIHSEVLNTAGYLISRRCAAQLLQMLSVMEKPVDVQMFAPQYHAFQGMRVMQMWPAICAQNDSVVQSAHFVTTLESSSIRDSHHLRH